MYVKELSLCLVICVFIVCIYYSEGQPTGSYGRQVTDRPCLFVCAIWCEYGNVLDGRGCPTCLCKDPPNRERRCPPRYRLVKPLIRCTTRFPPSRCGPGINICHSSNPSSHIGVCCRRRRRSGVDAY